MPFNFDWEWGACHMMCLYVLVGWPKPILPNRATTESFNKHLKTFWCNWNNNIHKSALIDFWSLWVFLNTIASRYCASSSLSLSLFWSVHLLFKYSMLNDFRFLFMLKWAKIPIELFELIFGILAYYHLIII